MCGVPLEIFKAHVSLLLNEKVILLNVHDRFCCICIFKANFLKYFIL